MIGKLTLDSPLEDCEVGVPKEITLIVTPTANDETFEADVDEVKDYEEEGDAGDEKGKGKMPTAVVIAIGNKPKAK